MGDLFSDAADRHASEVAPLAQRLRPATLGEFVGQAHVLGEGSALRRAIEEDRVHSSILYGPPGSGKTTLARIVAASTGAAFEELSAVSATVKDVREVLARARERLGTTGRRTILFLDEIHRFNKAQQDALLPGVESGLVTLIGATTENPYYEVNSALISRTQVYELEPLTPEDDSPRSSGAALRTSARAESDEVVELMAQRSGGDARTALNIVELAHQTAQAGSPSRRRTSRTRPASRRSSTTRPATRTTTTRPPSSSRCAGATPTPRSTTSPRCSRAARTRASSRAG